MGPVFSFLILHFALCSKNGLSCYTSVEIGILSACFLLLGHVGKLGDSISYILYCDSIVIVNGLVCIYEFL